MSTLIANLPSYEVWVRKEYLTDHQSGHGEFVKGVWVSAKSITKLALISALWTIITKVLTQLTTQRVNNLLNTSLITLLNSIMVNFASIRTTE